MSRLIIVGGGFSGLRAAIKLSHAPLRDGEIILLDPRPSFLFTPWLIDVLGGDKKEKDVSASFSTLAKRHGFTFIQGSVTYIHRQSKRLLYVGQNDADLIPLAYDALIYTPGSTVNFFGIPGAAEYALPLKSETDSLHIHARIERQIRQAAVSSFEKTPELFTFCVIGAGPTGVEAIFAIKRFVARLTSTWTEEQKATLRFMLLQAGPQILPGFPQKIVRGVEKDLARQGIELLTGDPVTQVSYQGLRTRFDRRIASGCVLWCAGIAPTTIPMEPEPLRDHGAFLAVTTHLRVDQSILAGGDAVTLQKRDRSVPKTAQSAMQMGEAIAEHITREQQKQSPRTFHFVPKGTMLILGGMGYLDLKWIIIRSRYIPLLRSFFYRLRFKQITGL